MSKTPATRERLIDGALAVLSEKGYRGATTREIAEVAGVTEVTLFRHFESKSNLVGVALDQATQSFREAGISLSGDVESDLIALATGYVGFIDRWPALADRVLPEISTDPDLGDRANSVFEGNAAAVRKLIETHQANGSLTPEPIDEAIRAFLGPLLARATLRTVLSVRPFDAEEYVRRFLDGRRS